MVLETRGKKEDQEIQTEYQTLKSGRKGCKIKS